MSSHPVRARRPVALTIVAWLIIVVGAGGILKDVVPLFGPNRAAALDALRYEGVGGMSMIWGVRMLAVVGGAFLLRRRNWARWLLVAWMLLHVGLSAVHSAGEALMHVVVFAVLTAILFARPAFAYLTANHAGERTETPIRPR